MAIVRTIQGDTVDRLCYRHLGSTAAVADVYALNPGLCKHGPVLAAGTAVTLPPLRPSTQTPTLSRLHLWD